MKKSFKKILLGMLLFASIGVKVSAAEATDAEIPQLAPMGVYEQMYTSAPQIQTFGLEDDLLPDLKEGRYTKWIDRVDFPYSYTREFYGKLEEAADNDGNSDFLINIWSDSSVSDITEYIEDPETGTLAKGVYAVDVEGEGRSWDEAAYAASENFLEKYYGIRSVYEAFDRDHPEVFWLSSTFYLTVPEYKGYTYYDQSYDESICVYTGKMYFVLWSDYYDFDIRSEVYGSMDLIWEGMRNVNARTDEILAATKGKKDHEKVAYFNEWLTTHNEYNYLVGYGREDILEVMFRDPDAFECTGALDGRIGENGPVCESYARAMKVLCDRAGIPCVLVDGFAKNGFNGDGEAHMWNYVQLEGRWYAVDVTWNDPLGGTSGAVSGMESEEYLLIGADTMTQIGDEMMRFIDSHPVQNQLFDDGLSYVNGPELCPEHFEHRIEEISITADFTEMDITYKESPTLTAVIELVDGESEAPSCQWYLVNAYGAEIPVEGATDAVFVFPEKMEGGLYTCRVKAVLGNDCESADIQIKINGFTDISGKDYFFDAACWAIDEGVTLGLTDETFGPYHPCSRDGIVTFLYRAMGKPEYENSNNPFYDVTEADYFYEPVLWAVENGVTTGLTEDRFGTYESCTREQIVTFLWRAAGCPEPSEGLEESFEDVTEADYFYKAVLWAVEAGITTGQTEALFGAYQECSRADAMLFLYRMNQLNQE